SCVLTRSQSAGHSFFSHPGVCSCIDVSISLVGIAYNLLLRNLWHPQGWQWVDDEMLHHIMPQAFMLDCWLYVAKDSLLL
ncbi:Pr6Pr family membrane protein, partial [Pseudomonas syringae pv. tagetis]|uniref:Pr6Pr family membrane protein n=1 Tax=Pseudomonas syringae group genomosp. 7 TaxID=251699 RepID=UPI00376F6F25